MALPALSKVVAGAATKGAVTRGAEEENAAEKSENATAAGSEKSENVVKNEVVAQPSTSPQGGGRGDVETDTPAVESAVQKPIESASTPIQSPILSQISGSTHTAASPISSAGSGIFGRSISELMADPKDDENLDVQVVETPVDPNAQDKIERHKDRFVEKLSRERPRIGVVFDTMSVIDNQLEVRVPSDGLREDVLRDKTEILQLLAAVAGVYGPIELQVVVDETVKPVKPIRLEDRLKHLTEANPKLTILRKTLELEVE